MPGPPFEIGAPLFHVWPPVCGIHPILYFKNVPPPSGFRPHHLVFGPPCCSDDGPAAVSGSKLWTEAALGVKRSDVCLMRVIAYTG